MLIDHLRERLREREAQSLRRARRIAETACAPRQRVSREGEAGGGRELLAFCSNDYLGLAAHPALAEALAEGARLHGTGSGASHLVSGHSRAHADLEDDLAALLAPSIPGARALFFSTGYMANLAVLGALGDARATIFSDKLVHASLIDGARLAAAETRRWPHGRADLLAAQLERCATPLKLIVTDAVFSMDGDLAPLPELLALAERHDAWLLVDDAHGFGVLGEGGRGTLAHFGLRSERFVYVGTLGKAAGVAGAFVAAHPVVIDWLVQSARSYIYTTAAPPAVAHALRESLRLIGGAEGDARRARLARLVALLRARLGALVAAHPALGWRLADSATAIQPLVVGDNAAALALSAALDAEDMWVPAIRPPTVPAGTARLRITLSASHDEDDVERLVAALARAAAGAGGSVHGGRGGSGNGNGDSSDGDGRSSGSGGGSSGGSSGSGGSGSGSGSSGNGGNGGTGCTGDSDGGSGGGGSATRHGAAADAGEARHDTPAPRSSPRAGGGREAAHSAAAGATGALPDPSDAPSRPVCAGGPPAAPAPPPGAPDATETP